jgi:mRNA interferase RelE/StbE
VASYKIFIKPSAAKELESVPTKDRRRLATKIKSLGSNPRPPGCEKLSGLERYRIRQGNYRVLYEIQDDVLIVLVVKVGHRKDVYR